MVSSDRRISSAQSLDQLREYYISTKESGIPNEASSFVSRKLIHNRAIPVESLVPEFATVQYGESEDPIKIPSPKNKKLDDTFGEYARTYYPRKGFVCEVADCDIVGANATALHNGTRPLLETSANRISCTWIGSHYGILSHAIQSHVGLRPKSHKNRLFPMVCPDPSYFHWVIEYLPKLRWYEQYCDRAGNDPPILIEQSPRSFVIDSIEHLGISTDQWIEWDGEASTVETLLIPNHRQHRFNKHDRPYTDYDPSKKSLTWLRDRAISNVSSETVKSPPTRIYISRQNADRGRRITNHDEVVSLLKSVGFEEVVLEQLRFDQQVKLFSEAEMVVGAHGAGLSNIVFSQDTAVLELFPETVVRPHFYCLAHILDLRYDSLVTEAIGNNLVVDSERLEDAVKRLQ